MNCPHCGAALSERGSFCKVCARQGRCMNCRELLEPEAAACVECGTKLGVRHQGTGTTLSPSPVIAASAQRNTLTYHEDKNSRSFEASLTDPAMQGLGDVLGEFFAQRGAARAAQHQPRFNKKEVDILTLPTLSNGATASHTIEAVTPPAQTVNDENSGEKERLLRIFTPKGQTFELSDNRLKADSARDYVRRLTYVFLYAHEIFGFPYPTESAVKAVLQTAKSWDASGNANKWLKGRIGITQEGEDRLKLTAPGREGAVSTLKDALDANIPDTWNPDKSALKQRPVRKKKA